MPDDNVTKSTQQLANEAMLDAEVGKVDPDLEPRDFSGGATEEELDAIVGVSPEYRYKHDGHRAYWAGGGSAEAELEKRHADNSDAIIVGGPGRSVSAMGLSTDTEPQGDDTLDEKPAPKSTPKPAAASAKVKD